MRIGTYGLLIAIALVPTTIAGPAGAQTSEEQALLQFQRAADTYAFHHRQVERHLGAAASPEAMAAAISAEQSAPREGLLFTPLVAAALRHRIQVALGKGGCAGPNTSLTSVVPRPNHRATATIGLSDCLVAALPRLPPELEFRSAGVVLVLVDVHAGLVVDIAHGAFPVKND